MHIRRNKITVDPKHFLMLTYHVTALSYRQFYYQSHDLSQVKIKYVQMCVVVTAKTLVTPNLSWILVSASKSLK